LLHRIASRHYADLLRFLRRRVRSLEDAADVAQDTFARLSQADLRQIREPASFLFTTALNLLRDRARSAHARHEVHTVPAEDAQLVCPAPQAERVLDAQQRLAVVEHALRELPPKCRVVFVLFHFDGLAQRTIAAQLGISVSMVEKYVKQAVGHCERRLAELNESSGRERRARP
jgi:RNA polymerase sigma-70 factor (ECF subfamily)